jgi:hypothetical protein
MALQGDPRKFMRITVAKDGTCLVTRPLKKDEIQWTKNELARLEEEHPAHPERGVALPY